MQSVCLLLICIHVSLYKLYHSPILTAWIERLLNYLCVLVFFMVRYPQL